MKKLLIKTIKFYIGHISPLFPPRCRYYPSCSAYALEAVTVHGSVKGCLLAIKRLSRCNIFFPGGVDPVPPKKDVK
ncbi:MAG TPA: membrane protein insertion efficiency factor YidD [Clostridiales bacterium]|nr:membrane protein insertion efficiency factor YidD [Clostridiales bacterium]